MGARISIQFQDPDGMKSPVLFSHWGGTEFKLEAKEYAKKLIQEVGVSQTMPLDRLGAGTVMVDFIRSITKDETRIQSDIYLGCTEKDGDNSDYGNHIIKLKKPRARNNHRQRSHNGQSR